MNRTLARINLVPIAAGIIIAIGDTTLSVTDNFSLAGIALGTIVCLVAYHLARAVAPASLRDEGAILAVGRAGVHDEESGDTQGGSHRAH